MRRRRQGEDDDCSDQRARGHTFPSPPHAPTVPLTATIDLRGRLAQLAERLLYTQEVARSSRAPPITREPARAGDNKDAASLGLRSDPSWIVGLRSGQLPSIAQVLKPTIPSTTRLKSFWNSLTAFSVFEPKSPSTAPGS